MNMNKTLTLLVVLLASTFAFVPANAQHMSERKVEKVFKKLDLEVEGDEGVWMVNFSDRWVLVFADDAADPIALTKQDFLVSFLVDARGGSMKGCRFSGVKVRLIYFFYFTGVQF
mgnify:CR=1 FL=1